MNKCYGLKARFDFQRARALCLAFHRISTNWLHRGAQTMIYNKMGVPTGITWWETGKKKSSQKSNFWVVKYRSWCTGLILWLWLLSLTSCLCGIPSPRHGACRVWSTKRNWPFGHAILTRRIQSPHRFSAVIIAVSHHNPESGLDRCLSILQRRKLSPGGWNDTPSG